MNLKRADLIALKRSNFPEKAIKELQSYCYGDEQQKSKTCFSCKAALFCAAILAGDVVRLVVAAIS